MNKYQISIIFDIMEEFMKKNRISKIKEWNTLSSSTLIILILDGVGRKEFSYMLKKTPKLNFNYSVPLNNPLPNTRKAYEQMFFQGERSIEAIVEETSTNFLIIDNRIELSLFSDRIKKIHRKTDEYVLAQIKNNANTNDILWGHLMMIDHASHNSSKRIRSVIPVLGNKLQKFIHTLTSDSIILILGDHGPHHYTFTKKGRLSRKEKRVKQQKSLKTRYYASRTFLNLVKV